MSSTAGRLTPVKIAAARWLGDFYAQYRPDTRAGSEWAQRGASTAMVFVPGRMVDQVEEMLSSWRGNDNSGKAGTSSFGPILFLAVAQDYTDTPGGDSRPQLEPLSVVLPGDPLQRVFQVEQIQADIRAQVVVVASESATAHSIMSQLARWEKRRQTFRASYTFAGVATDWPVQVVQADRMAVPTPVGEHLCILGLDLTLRASMPLFSAPAGGSDDSDGQGSGTAEDPNGIRLASEIESGHVATVSPPDGVSPEDWAAFLRLSGLAPGSGGAPNVILHPVQNNPTK